LSGFFGTVGLALSLDPTYGADKVAEFGDDSMALADTYKAVMGGPVIGGGRIALLLKAEDAYSITAAVAEVDLPPKDAVDEADLPHLTEALEACAGGGAGYFKEKYGNPVEFEGMVIGALSAESLQEFRDAGPGIVAEFTFDIPDIAHGKGVLLVSEVLAEAVPEDEPQPPEDDSASLTKDEVQDILSDFDDAGADQEQGTDAAAAGAEGIGATSENIGRVLDIQLTATARLGRIEMPIQDILSLGPGSIVEVGHVVDEPVELLVNNKLIARGDVVVVDEKFGLRITEIITPEERIESLS
jgi:flagellar motor switch protein FliN/FliY